MLASNSNPFTISGAYTLYRVEPQKQRVVAASVFVPQLRMGA